MIDALAGFLVVATVVIVAPGPDTALTIRNSLLGGRRGGIATGGGVATGQAIWTVAAGAGVAALLLTSRPAFIALRFAGAVYLIYLGLHSLRQAIRPPAADPTPTTGAERRLGTGHAYRQGVLNNLANPKMAVFFVSLLPQFAGASRPTLSAMLALGLLFSVMTFAWLTACAAAVARVGDLLRRTRPRRILDGLTGSALVGLGFVVVRDGL